MPLWQRLVIVGVVVVVTVVVARLIDRSIATTIIFVGLFSALLVIPQVRAVAGGILASSAVLGLVIGFASQRTIGNFVAGLLIAFTQPLRIGDLVEVDGTRGVVEEIGLTYTFIRTDDGSRLVIPNEKLASDTIRNSTIRSPEKLAEVAVQVPLSNDLDAVVAQLRELVADDVAADAGSGCARAGGARSCSASPRSSARSSSSPPAASPAPRSWAATSTRCGPSRSARTRSSTPSTARSSARYRPSATASP